MSHERSNVRTKGLFGRGDFRGLVKAVRLGSRVRNQGLNVLPEIHVAGLDFAGDVEPNLPVAFAFRIVADANPRDVDPLGRFRLADCCAGGGEEFGFLLFPPGPHRGSGALLGIRGVAVKQPGFKELPV